MDGIASDLDGIDTLGMEIEHMGNDLQEEAGFMGVFAGRTQKGYVPYNPHKVNQDWMLIKDDVASGTLVLGTFDGHGEHGHCVSEVFSFVSV